jgi:4-amino-4-deoxy-L-arabinose transferase-like glycosyltransferase
MRKKEWLLIFLILLLASSLRFILLDSIPGLHFDEARHGITAKNIIKGIENPLIQQGGYAGNFAYYFISLEFLMTNKYDTLSLRFLIVVLNVISIIFLYFAIREYNKRAALLTALVLSFLPFHVIFSRIAWPEFTLIPFFFSVCLFLFINYQRTKNIKYLYLFLFFFFVGIGNKLIFLIYAPSFFLYLLIYNRKVFNFKFFLIMFLFFIIGTFPLLLHNISNKLPVLKDIKYRNMAEILESYPNFYKSLYGVLDGSMAFLRIGGEENSYYAFLNPIVFLASIIILFKNKNRLFKFLTLSYLVFAPLFLALTANFLFAPRYFITILPFLAITIGFFFDGLFKFLKKNHAFIFLLLFFSLNIGVIFYNFILLYNNHIDFGSFKISNHIEAKDHFIPTFKDISRYISNYSGIYFYEHFFGDPRSVFEFETNKPVHTFQLENFKNTDKDKIYFAIDPSIHNESLEKIKMFGINYEVVEFKNRLDQTIIKMYILSG